ncbi:MAG: SRPBCC domain-containing protein [Acidobacteriota bacterium]|nr:SRPBCC domain-containing protein [Acidobacteriota bacterium]
MQTNVAAEVVQTFELVKEEEIAAPIQIVFETILEQMGPHNETPNGESLQMKLEAWPGGRWFRDLGNDTGHFWGLVQAIKAPTLLEISGPLFMSTPAVSNVQYRLTEEAGLTRVRFVHRAMGWLPDLAQIGAGMDTGWTSLMTRIRESAERRASASRQG